MSAPQSRVFPVSGSSYLIIVSEYRRKLLRGHLCCPSKDRSYPFDCLMELLLLMQREMDAADYPQRSMEPRLFQDSTWQAALPPADHAAPGPRLASFTVTVLFRHNASWQGVVTWNERMLESRFRSALELLSLLDNALSALPGTGGPT